MAVKTVAELESESERLSKKVSSKKFSDDDANRLSQIALEKNLVIFNQLKVDMKEIKQHSKVLRTPKEAAKLLKFKYEQYTRLRNNIVGFLEDVDGIRRRGSELVDALQDVKSRYNNSEPLSRDDIEVFNEILRY